MKISLKELELISSTPENECFLCNDILYHIEINPDGEREISDIYFKRNPDIREHLRQIIKR
jgi:hypothetical protein